MPNLVKGKSTVNKRPHIFSIKTCKVCCRAEHSQTGGGSVLRGQIQGPPASVHVAVSALTGDLVLSDPHEFLLNNSD